MKVKTGVTYGIAVLFLLGCVVVVYQAFAGVSPPFTPAESFNEALWGTWGAAIIIISFVLFAGGTGILVLLGGGWRWE
jgi:hypothetical protein